MQIGFNLPAAGNLAAPDALARLAVEGEAMGFDYADLQRPRGDPERYRTRAIPIPRAASFPPARAATGTSS